MHGRFSIIGGMCPGCPPKVYAYVRVWNPWLLEQKDLMEEGHSLPSNKVEVSLLTFPTIRVSILPLG